MPRLVLIDGHAILHRAFHALPPLTTSKGEPIQAVYGFTSILLRVVHDLKPSHLLVTFDRPKPTFRKKLYKEYQAKRPKADETFISQIEIVHRLLKSIGIPIFEKDGFEADDVIGTINKKINKKEMESVIVTGDRDILQLVGKKTKVYMPVKGLSESKLYGETDVEEKFGVKPALLPDLKALMGDASDNYPGVAGIGPKTAAELITKYHSVENLYNHLDELAPKIKEKLEKNKENAFLGKTLATIVTNVPLELNLSGCQLILLDRPDVRALFEELEFRSLIPRLSTNPSSSSLQKNKSAETKKVEKKQSKVVQTALF